MMLAQQESRDLVQQKQINALKAGLETVLQTKSNWADQRLLPSNKETLIRP
jgi:hypothetical protein